MTHDMTKGSPLRLIVTFTIPLLIGNIFQQLYSMADTIIVGRTLGTNALAAVGSTGALSFLVLGFFFGLTSGCTVITAQRYGAKDHAGVRRSVVTSTILCTVITLVITLISLLLTGPMLREMNTPADIYDGAFHYIFVIFLGTPAVVFYNLIASLIRALGDSRTPLIFLIVSSVLNIALDFVFILWFGWGVAGAAWATVLSLLVAGWWCLVYARRHFPLLRVHRADWHFDWGFAWEHLKVALPMALQFSITAIGVVVMQAVLNRFGSTAVAAFTAASKIDMLAVQPAISLGITMATFCAQNYGAGKFDRIRRGVNRSSVLMLAVSAAGSVLMIVFYPQLTRLFVGEGEPEVVRLVGTYMWSNASLYVILGMLFVYRHSLQGMGHAFVPMLAGVSELFMRSFGAPLMGAALGYVGVCLSNPLAWIGATVPLAIWYFRIIHRLTGRYIR